MQSFSTKDPHLTLAFLLERRESQFFEIKGRSIKPSKLANEIIGMLNASGGVIALGISDEGQLEDLSALPPAQLDHFRKVIHDHITPPAHVELEEITLESGELLFLYHVEQDYERLFKRQDNEDVYLRVADSNKGPLTRDEVKKLEYNKPIRSYEDELREDFDPAHLRPQTCEEYRGAMRYQGTFEELAVKRGLAIPRDGRAIYKNAAILLFAQDPGLYIPSALIRYVRYAGIDSKSGSDFNVIKDERIEGNIPGLVKTLETFIEGSLRDYYFLNLKQGKFERIPEYPKEAWLEGIINALCHRSYNLQGNSIYIRHFDDRLVIANSGPLPAQVTVENIRTERYSRNPRIARALSDLGYVRELNEGVPRIYGAMRESMLAEPVYTNTHDSVTLTLRNQVASRRETIHSDVLIRIETQWPHLNPSQRELLDHLFETFDATIETLAGHLHIGEQAVRYNLKRLEELHIITRISDKIRDRNAIYRFADQ